MGRRSTARGFRGRSAPRSGARAGASSRRRSRAATPRRRRRSPAHRSRRPVPGGSPDRRAPDRPPWPARRPPRRARCSRPSSCRSGSPARAPPRRGNVPEGDGWRRPGRFVPGTACGRGRRDRRRAPARDRSAAARPTASWRGSRRGRARGRSPARRRQNRHSEPGHRDPRSVASSFRMMRRRGQTIPRRVFARRGQSRSFRGGWEKTTARTWHGECSCGRWGPDQKTAGGSS